MSWTICVSEMGLKGTLITSWTSALNTPTYSHMVQGAATEQQPMKSEDMTLTLQKFTNTIE